MSIWKRILRWSAIVIGVLLGLYLVAALVMIFLPQPTPSATTLTVSDEDLAVGGARIEQVYDYQVVQFAMRDGTQLSARYLPADSQRVVLMVHGVTGSSQFLNEPAGRIREATGASVYALDLRGHGSSGGKRGDIDYVGQYEDDLADTIAAIRDNHRNHQLVVLGYSMGGAVALRYAAQSNQAVDGYVLVAPNLGIDAPTARTEAPTALDPTVEPFLQLHLPRLIGISMLNGLGIRVFNGMPTMFFNLPAPFVHTYSYRAMMNSTPDYRTGFASIDQPLLVVVGSADETMIAEAFPALVAEYGEGEVRIVDGANHNEILYSQAMIDAIGNWMPPAN